MTRQIQTKLQDTPDHQGTRNCRYRIEQVRTTLGNAQYPDRQWQMLGKVVPAKQKQPQTCVYPVNGNRKEQPTACRCVCECKCELVVVAAAT